MRTTWARRSRWGGRSRSTWRAGPRPSGAARTPPSSPPSSGRWRRPTSGSAPPWARGRARPGPERCLRERAGGGAPLPPIRPPLPDPDFSGELARLLRDYVGRPTPLYRAGRLSEVVGGEVWLKREDLTHTGSHKINNAIGQALLASRMGKPRVIAETGAGQHGVASATACALLGLECIVYMGTED